MTMTEGVVDALTLRDGRPVLALRLPWYRSLPLSCLESVTVTVDGVPVPVEVPRDTATWELRDPLDVALGIPVDRGAVVTVGVDLAVRIPYIQVAPGVPLVRRTVVRTEATVR